MKKLLGPETVVIGEVVLFALLTFGFFQWFKHGRPSPVGDAAGKGLETAATFFGLSHEIDGWLRNKTHVVSAPLNHRVKTDVTELSS